jgi:hypothetical protein
MLKTIRTLASNFGKNSKLTKLPKIKNYRTITMCDKCYAFYYKNSWHLKRPSYLNEYSDEEIPVLFTQCGACLEQEDALFEKELDLILQ